MASSSMFWLTRSTNFSRIRPRRCGFMAPHSGWAFSAAATTFWTSSRLASGRRDWTSPVHGIKNVAETAGRPANSLAGHVMG